MYMSCCGGVGAGIRQKEASGMSKDNNSQVEVGRTYPEGISQVWKKEDREARRKHGTKRTPFDEKVGAKPDNKGVDTSS